MFVEVFGQKLNYGNSAFDSVTAVGIVSLNKVVNVDAIRSIDIVGTMFGDKKYHRIGLDNTSEETISKIYISDQDYERIIHL